jgi:RimJ/RimL family protein N-acetyltransferase
MHLLFNNDQTVADWMSKKWGKPVQGWYFAVGILNNEGLLKGGMSFHNFNGSNIEMCYYGPNTFSRDISSGLANFLFEYLKVNRLTVSVPRKNKILLRHLPKFGFKVEGVLKHFYGPYKKDDAIIFGMLKEDGIKYMRNS